MKGVELPVNVLVIIVIAVIVIIALVAMLTGAIPILGPASQSAAFNAACQVLITGQRCSIEDATLTIDVAWDVNGLGGQPDGKINPIESVTDPTIRDTLFKMCTSKYQATTDAACKKLCGCPGL